MTKNNFVAHMRENSIKNRFTGLFKIERAQIECEQFNMIVPDTFWKFGNTWPQVRLCPHSWEWLAESSWDLICPTTHSHPSTDHLELAYSILLGTSNYIFYITLILCHRCCPMIKSTYHALFLRLLIRQFENDVKICSDGFRNTCSLTTRSFK